MLKNWCDCILPHILGPPASSPGLVSGQVKPTCLYLETTVGLDLGWCSVYVRRDSNWVMEGGRCLWAVEKEKLGYKACRRAQSRGGTGPWLWWYGIVAESHNAVATVPRFGPGPEGIPHTTDKEDLASAWCCGALSSQVPFTALGC